MRKYLTLGLFLAIGLSWHHQAQAAKFSWKSHLGMTEKNFISAMSGIADCQPTKRLWYYRIKNYTGKVWEEREGAGGPASEFTAGTSSENKQVSVSGNRPGKGDNRRWVASDGFERMECVIRHKPWGSGTIKNQETSTSVLLAYLYNGHVFSLIIEYPGILNFLESYVSFGASIWLQRPYDSAIDDAYGPSGAYVAGPAPPYLEDETVFSEYKELLGEEYFARKLGNLARSCTDVSLSCSSSILRRDLEYSSVADDFLIRRKVGFKVDGNFLSAANMYEISEDTMTSRLLGRKLIASPAKEQHFSLIREERQAFTAFQKESSEVEAIFQSRDAEVERPLDPARDVLGAVD